MKEFFAVFLATFVTAIIAVAVGAIGAVLTESIGEMFGPTTASLFMLVYIAFVCASVVTILTWV